MAKDAADLLEEAAENPEMDKFFERMPPFSPEEFINTIKKNRRDRASWGGVDQPDETVDQ